MTLPHTLLDNVLRVKALEYASTLGPGSTMTEHDWRHVANFAHLLPAAMAHHGLVLVNGICERIDNNEREVA